MPKPLRPALLSLAASLLFMILGVSGVSAASHGHTNSIGMEFVLIPSGDFLMGADRDNRYTIGDDTPPHTVLVGKAFYLGKYEVTQAQWKAVMGTTPSASLGDNKPVESITWEDAQEFIRRLNEKEGHARYRLPSESEWEYASRGGSTNTPFFFGNEIDKLRQYAWFNENSDETTHPVGQKKPNPFGLYDIYGNVRELVQDNHEYPGGAMALPEGPFAGPYPIARGGSWSDIGSVCHSVFRFDIAPDTMRIDNIGFRLALSPEE